jgi:hypothetical protein
MDTLPPAHVTEFVVQLLNTGHTVGGVVERLAEALTEATGDPIEETRHAVIAMAMGTIGVRLAATPPHEFVLATKLIEQALAVLIGDLDRAAKTAEQRERGIRTVRSSHERL